MAEFEVVLNNIIKKPEDVTFCYNRVFVVSAYAGVTDILLEDKKSNEPGIYKMFIDDDNSYKEKLDEISNRFSEINKSLYKLGLDVKKADCFIEKRIEHTKRYLDSMEEILSSGYIGEANIYSAAREILASLGEAHSAYNTYNILLNRDINTEFIDLTGFFDRRQLSIEKRIEQSFRSIDLSNKLIITPGYTKDKAGMITKYGRGYSEITFSQLATFLNADQAIIHKEHHLSSADPEIVGKNKAIPVGRTNYDVADQLADIGMEAIHPKASKPLELAGISIRIRNTFEPTHPGTLITRNYRGKESRVEVISGTDKVMAIEVHDPLMVGQVGFDLNLMKLVERYHISYILKATNANSITTVIWEKDRSKELIRA